MAEEQLTPQQRQMKHGGPREDLPKLPYRLKVGGHVETVEGQPSKFYSALDPKRNVVESEQELDIIYPEKFERVQGRSAPRETSGQGPGTLTGAEIDRGVHERIVRTRLQPPQQPPPQQLPTEAPAEESVPEDL